jgi:hypothetical protein
MSPNGNAKQVSQKPNLRNLIWSSYCVCFLSCLYFILRLFNQIKHVKLLSECINVSPFKMAAVFKGNDYLPLKFASVSFYCQVSDTGSVG